MFCFIRGSERDGLGKLVGREGGHAVVEYFDCPSINGCTRRKVLSADILRKALGRNTRVHTFDERNNEWRIGRVREDDGEGVEVRLADKVDVYLPYDQVFVRWKRAMKDPVVFLGNFVTETPLYAQARSDFLRSYLAQRAGAFGISALLSSSIEIEPHQVGVIRRVLTDPSQRYLLADEVGLGKTVEAGVVIRQAVLDDLRGHRVLVLVPHALVSQWRRELTSRFALGDFLDESVLVLPHEDSPELRSALQGLSLMVIDEAHHLADPNASVEIQELYRLVSQVTKSVERLLLLSATPILRNETGFLRMLHMLDSVVYPLEDIEHFHAKIVNRQALAENVAALHPSNALFMDAALDDLMTRIPNDARLRKMTIALKDRLLELPEEDDQEFCDSVQQLRAHISETYRLNRRILRNRRKHVAGLTPERKGVQTWSIDGSPIASLESNLEDWRIAASACMEPSGSVMRESVEDFYWRAAQSLLEAPGSMHVLCAERIRGIVSGVCPSFPEELQLLETLQKSFDEKEWMALRINRLCDGLRPLLEGTKAVVFCATESCADEVFIQLKQRHFGVVRHSSEDTEEGGASDDWNEFLTNSAIRVIVCGINAEEGINLQGGRKVVVHFDLPVQPNRIEQRMGRVDRYGSGDPVLSFVLLDQVSPLQEAWFGVLNQGLGVFHRSISSLQYLVEAEMLGLHSFLVHGGVEALHSLLDRFEGPHGLVVRELKLIDEQDALDELSPVVESDLDDLFDADGDWKNIRHATLAWIVDALLFQRVNVPNPTNASSIDEPFRLHYCPPDGDNKQPTLIPSSSFIDDFLGAIDFGALGNSSTRPRSHLFALHRPTAVRRGIRPLRYGAEFVEAIKSFSDMDDRGRSFAMWRQVYDHFPSSEIRMCFRFDFLIEASLDEAISVLSSTSVNSEQSARSVLARRGDALFYPVVIPVWVDEEGDELNQEFVGRFLLPVYAKNGGEGYIDKNLEMPHLRAFRRMVPETFANWGERCTRMRDRAFAIVMAREELMHSQRTAVKRALAEDETRYAQLQTRIESLNGAEAQAESSQLMLERALGEALRRGIATPSVKVDVAGVVFLTSESVSMIERVVQEQA
jgi:ATP-dependent helicase HepA